MEEELEVEEQMSAGMAVEGSAGRLLLACFT